MPTQTQNEFLKNQATHIKGPVLIVGAKVYGYDAFDFRTLLTEMGVQEIIGIDILEGDGVDRVVDITNSNDTFFKEKEGYFNTIICMSVLMYVGNPFNAGTNLSRVANQGSKLFLSEPFTHKTTAMPLDMWRFTFDSLAKVFADYSFDVTTNQCSFTRSNIVFKDLRDASSELVQGVQHPDESWIAFIWRRIGAKLFARGFFKISRLMPEISIFALGTKNE